MSVSLLKEGAFGGEREERGVFSFDEDLIEKGKGTGRREEGVEIAGMGMGMGDEEVDFGFAWSELVRRRCLGSRMRS